MTLLFFANQSTGAYLGSFDGGSNGAYWNGTSWGPPPSGVIQVPSAPNVSGQVWSGSIWIDTPTSLANEALITFNSMLSSGLGITSTGTPSLNGTYAIDQTSQQNISGIASGIASRNRLPGGGSTFNYGDVSGNLHTFSQANFLNFAAAVEDFCYVLYQTLATIQGGGSASWPTASVTIS